MEKILYPDEMWQILSFMALTAMIQDVQAKFQQEIIRKTDYTAITLNTL